MYGNKWYPLRGLVNHAKEIGGETGDLATDRALVELAFLMPYIRIANIQFINLFPVIIDQVNTINEIRYLSDSIRRLL